MAKKATTVLSVRELQTKKSARFTGRRVKDSEIDYSDIPEFSEEVLSKFQRRGRPVLGEAPRKAISIRIDQGVLEKIKNKAKRKGIAYQSLINEILKKAV